MPACLVLLYLFIFYFLINHLSSTSQIPRKQHNHYKNFALSNKNHLAIWQKWCIL
ncbi:hypothetical protein [Moraxella lacunata]|uniref:hypothetical protein n=1 Tax=Moraxella lacunata TaxID=477 RepID=UPI003EDE8E1A